ncbi:MAG: DNA replication protein DnaD [Clostridia bacterium]|nr:DNA replication protein DnaD [Clostridia bacterium]
MCFSRNLGKEALMEDKKYTLSMEQNLALPSADADRLIASGDGTATLLYLYALRNRGGFSSQSAAASLKRTEAEILKAISTLCELGLFKTGENKKPVPLSADELPEYTAQDIAARTCGNSEFKAIVEETQRIMGHLLTGADLKTLFGIYDFLRLPTEVIFLLINHCVEETREHLGQGKLPSMRTIEKEAYVWYNREILTLERAEEFLLQKRTRSGEMADIKRLLQISGRNFSATERKYVETWIDMGFELEALALAYDKTIVKTGNLAWKYMDSILQSWHGKKLHTAQEITSGDTHQGAVSGAVPRQGGQAVVRSSAQPETERMKKIWEKVKNG